MALATFAPLVTGLGQAVADALVDTPKGRPQRVVRIAPGAIAADECDCGQLALTVVRKYAADTFPVEASRDEAEPGCPPPILCAVVTVQLLRCVPVMDDNGVAPTPAELEDAAVGQDADDAAIRRALYCHLATLVEEEAIVGYVVGATSANGPEGACGGSDTTVTIGINNCGCS